MDDRILTPEGDMDADAVDYSLSRRDVSAVLFAVDREDREALCNHATIFPHIHARAVRSPWGAVGGTS